MRRPRREFTPDERASIDACNAILPPIDQVTILRAADVPEHSYTLRRIRRLY